MIYLDSAATTLQKPACVAKAVSWAIQNAASPGRGGHSAAMTAAEIVFSCRDEAAELFQVSDPANVIFTFNATHSLNLAIKTLVHHGDTVVISGYEHNAVTRTLNGIPNVNVQVANSKLFDSDETVRAFEELLQRGANVVVCTHVSNVFGYILPIEEISLLCQRYHVPLIIDASQSAGVLPISMEQLKAAFIAMPGHKGLYGPQGTGLLLCGQLPTPIMEGGTGSSSLLQTMPEFLPDRVEAGTHNVAGIAGLLQGLRFVKRIGTENIERHECRLIKTLIRGLKKYRNIEVFSAQKNMLQTGVLSFRVLNRDCEQVGEWLSQKQIAVRSGLHCAPLAHKSAGTLETGTVRVSVSAFNKMWEMERFLNTIHFLSK